LRFTEETRTKEILSLNAAGRVREYRLIYRVGFGVGDAKGNEYLPPSTVTLTRDVTYDDAVALAKETEEQLMFRDMQADMVQQILRRLTAARAPASASAAD
jgi:LPS-assembly lipoprotein